jgi:Domain of unknown function (DUF4431)
MQSNNLFVPRLPSLMLWAVFTLAAVQSSERKAASALRCLTYEPSVVKLTGTLVRRTFPGPPNYEDIRHGDRAETYWFIQLSRPVCVAEDREQSGLNPAKKDIRLVQLVVDDRMYKQYKGLVGTQIIAAGTLFGEHTGHHHTPVLLKVTGLAAKP